MIAKIWGNTWKIKVGPATNISSVGLPVWVAITPMAPNTVHAVNNATNAVPIIMINPLLVLLLPIGAQLEKIIMAPVQVDNIKNAWPKASVQILLVSNALPWKANIVCKPLIAPGNVKT